MYRPEDLDGEILALGKNNNDGSFRSAMQPPIKVAVVRGVERLHPFGAPLSTSLWPSSLDTHPPPA